MLMVNYNVNNKSGDRQGGSHHTYMLHSYNQNHIHHIKKSLWYANRKKTNDDYIYIFFYVSWE